MKKHLRKKLVLDRSTLRVLTALEEGQVVGGISGLRGCHSIDIRCGTGGTGGATCNDTSEDNCVTGLGSQCGC